MKLRNLAAFLVLMGAGVCAWAEGTHTWTQSTFEEFEKGTAKGIAVRNDGKLELAPAFRLLATTPSTYIWSIAVDAHGGVYLAAGAPARVYAVTPDGKTSVIFEPKELQVQSLVADRNGVIYAATSPDGKVYRIEHHPATAKQQPGPDSTSASADWTATMFFDPRTKYIWALALDREDHLYVATGDHGEIYRVDDKGNGSLFFDSDEAHIRALAFDAQGNLIAGSDGSGLIYRISPQGKAFVLYSAPKKEITALAIDGKGNIYAAATGEKRAAPPAETPKAAPIPSGASPATAPALPAGAPAGAAPATVPVAPSVPFPGLGAIGSEIYQIAPDGSPKRIWSSRDDLVYALGFDARGRLLAGSGNKGRVFLIRGEQQFTDLVKASASQVTGFAKSPNGDIYVCTSNLGKIFLLGDAPEAEGTYVSDVFDARTFSQWGRARVRGAGAFELWARSGNVDNPDRNWSPWAQVDLRKSGPLAVPAARFVQWKALLRPGHPDPQLESVTLNYLPKNVAPVVEGVDVLVGARFPALPKPNPGDNAPPHTAPVPAVVHDRGWVAVRWAAHDDNDDRLEYSLYYRGSGETRWQLLKDKITDKYHSFEAGLLPDGGYTLKVVASDAPSNPPDAALTDERESPYFELDTTPPRIEDLKASLDNGGLHITFRASDNFSAIKRAEYSLDAGDWQYIVPVGGISDARTEDYSLTLPAPDQASQTQLAKQDLDPAPATAVRKGRRPAKAAADPPAPADIEHVVVVRVWDRFDNMASAKTVIRAK
jgi:WD40 repeat protein